MKAICIDDLNKPEQIPQEEWIEAGIVYTVKKLVPLGFKKGKYGILLEEIELTSKSMPYESYDAERFIIFPFDIEIEPQTNALDLDDVDLSNLS
jgi:hypothetical protein